MKEDVQEIAKKHIEQNDYLGWFEEIYQKGKNEGLEIPWVSQEVNPYVKYICEKLNVEGNNKQALVIGCGLGEDSEYLSGLGFQVDAFDFSPTVIEWCKQIHTERGVNYFVADLLDLPKDLPKYDFVLEIYTLQTLPISEREKAIFSLPSIIKHGGEMVLICRIKDIDEITEGVPFPLTLSELATLQTSLILTSSERLLSDQDAWKRICNVYKKP